MKGYKEGFLEEMVFKQSLKDKPSVTRSFIGKHLFKHREEEHVRRPRRGLTSSKGWGEWQGKMAESHESCVKNLNICYYLSFRNILPLSKYFHTKCYLVDLDLANSGGMIIGNTGGVGSYPYLQHKSTYLKEPLCCQCIFNSEKLV